MGFVSLRDALGLLVLYAAEESPKYEKAATRWLARLALETDDPSLADIQLAAAAPPSPAAAARDCVPDVDGLEQINPSFGQWWVGSPASR